MNPNNQDTNDATGEFIAPVQPAEGQISRRSFVHTATFAGAVLGALAAHGFAQEPGSGGHSNDALARMPPGEPKPGESMADKILAVKIQRAMQAGPPEITKDATVADMDEHGNMTVLRKGTNSWVCMPGDENKIGDPPMCADPMAMQWFMDAFAKKPKPTNPVPGLAYMLCGATQHSNTDALDTTSPAIPIGPHWMIMWPFDAKTCGLPTTVRDAGAWVMFDGTPYAYLHVCGTPWVGNEYHPGDEEVWTMRYAKPRATQQA